MESSMDIFVLNEDNEELQLHSSKTESVEHINLTRNPEKAVQFVLEKLN